MADILGAAPAVVTIIAGWALVVRAGYLSYVALPSEHTGRHLTARAALVVGGLVLVLLGTRLLL